ncbi:MAG: bifunctional acetate--CoA ligase family protein/GNAT family N-acetyltransferase [Verrucomicrobiota bacterium]
MVTALHPKADPSHDILRARAHPLDALFEPRSVAIIGASEKPGSVGLALTQNLLGGLFGGAVYPINPRHAHILGAKAFARIADVPAKVDLAVIASPAKSIPGVMRECAAAGVPAAIIISAGFKECGAEGTALEQEILGIARAAKMRVVGPNCLGVMRPHHGFNATFATALARPGSVGFISQSGALCTAVLDWSFRENVGFSAFVSLGSMLDVGWGDLIYYLGDDPHTRSIVIYMESVGDARAFLSAAREVALSKPIIVIKVGRTNEAAKAAASHTGSLTGSDEVLDAAFRRAGVLRVNAIEELFDMAEVLAKQPRPTGPRLAIVTNAGGPGVLATDMLITSGGQLAPLSAATMAALNHVLPAHWSHNNPIDIIGDAGAERYAQAVDIIAKDDHNDGVLVILTPQAMTDATATAEQLKPLARLNGKPILASWMGGPQIDAGDAILNAASIPTFRYPDEAARAFVYMWRYSQNLRALYETPALPAEEYKDRARAAQLIDKARRSGRTLLTEAESKHLLHAYGIPVVETHVATTEDEAVKFAEQMGFPVVLKLHSETITHKTDVGGVQLDLRDAAAVRDAWRAVKNRVALEHFHGVTVQRMIRHEGYELILGSSLDPQFGPVLLFGAGGQLVEVFQDRALGLPPLNATLARRLMEQTKIYRALKGVRGRQPVDLAALEQLLVRFSQLVAEQRWIAEIDINPLLVSADGLIALDARVVLHDAAAREESLPRLAIRPYPAHYGTPCKLKDGTHATLRPIRPEDEPLMVKFHEALSEGSVYLRYFTLLKLDQRIAHERLTRVCFIDYDCQMALVADQRDAATGEHRILGVGRLIKAHDANEAEFALLVADRYQHCGLGTQLLSQLIHIGREEKLARITGDVLPTNTAMLRLCDKLGFQRTTVREDHVVKVVLEL